MRELRLKALQTEPLAFGSTYARERAFDELTWRARSASGTRLFAVPAAAPLIPPVGMVGAVPVVEPGVLELVAMYVIPEFRGSGVADQLVRAVIDRAVAAGNR